jgi:exodeoxyribonuclease V alpha subunit
MAVHISVRLAWHNDGWNGHICQNPKANTYCIGMFSYPGQVIRERRDLDTENQLRGKLCSQIKFIPPCCFSINAFGKDTITAFDKPPDFFHDEADPKEWPLPPATISIWPYEVMFLVL